MASSDSLLSRIFHNIIFRNLVLAVCGIIVFVFILSLLLNVATRHDKYKDVPDFSGMSVEQAERVASKEALQVELNDSVYVSTAPPGAILDQMPKPGTQVKSGRRIFVTVNSQSRKMVGIPYVTGFSLRQAKNNLQLAGLEIDRIIYQEDIATNYVLEEQYNRKVIGPNSKMEAEQGSGITLVVGLNPGEPLPVMPRLLGLSLSEAKNRLWEAGMNVGTLNFDDNVTLATRNEARVYKQSPELSVRVDHGASVNLYFTIDDEKLKKNVVAAENAARARASAMREQASDDSL